MQEDLSQILGEDGEDLLSISSESIDARDASFANLVLIDLTQLAPC